MLSLFRSFPLVLFSVRLPERPCHYGNAFPKSISSNSPPNLYHKYLTLLKSPSAFNFGWLFCLVNKPFFSVTKKKKKKTTKIQTPTFSLSKRDCFFFVLFQLPQFFFFCKSYCY